MRVATGSSVQKECYNEGMTKCSIENCENPLKFKAKKLCSVHYHRIRAHGNPHTVLRTPTGTPLRDRVTPNEKWLDVERGYTSACREWAGRRDDNGYGVIKYNNRVLRLHRVMYEMEYGEIPGGMVVMHQCDNPPCARLDHLKTGTQDENIQDAVRKGRNRAPRGLKDNQVHDIRIRWRQGETQQALEEEYGLSGGTVSRIMTGKIYRNVPDESKDVPVNKEARVRSVTPEKLKQIRACVEEGSGLLEIAKKTGVDHRTVRKLYPGHRERNRYLESMNRNGEVTVCGACGRTSLTQNLKRHQSSKTCQQAALAKSTRVAV